MERFVLRRTGRRPLAFTGERIYADSTSPDRAHPDYSGSPGRWTEVEVYRTAKGKFVVYIAAYTVHQGESDHYEALVFDQAEDAVAYLEKNGPSWAASGLSEKLGVAEEI